MTLDRDDADRVKAAIRAHGRALGFDAIGFSGVDLPAAEAGLAAWLAAGHHGEMDYMARHGPPGEAGTSSAGGKSGAGGMGGSGMRTRPALLVPGTLSVITARINYLSAPLPALEQKLAEPGTAYVSVYAHGRDYHKVLRNKLQKLADRIAAEIGPFGYRVFTDSAPVMEVALAEQSGLGWRGKHTLLLDRSAGSFFFLGEIYTGLALPPDAPVDDHCGTCFACQTACPTGAITGPYQLDARRCISYLTIELKGAIPAEFRPLIGNRIYGCDDCQLVCPWNKFAQAAHEPDFLAVRNGLDQASLLDLFAWSEEQFKQRMAGSAIGRIGYAKWLSNIAIALGNALRAQAAGVDTASINQAARLRSAPAASLEGHAAKARIHQALQGRANHEAAVVRESVQWAQAQDVSAASAASGTSGTSAAPVRPG